MHDIRIPSSGGSSQAKKTDFEVTQVSGSESRSLGNPESRPEPGEKVKVKFENFVQLVATHNFEEVMKRHAGDDIIVNTNLLTDLANAHEEAPDHSKKLPLLFIIGILVGVVVTYLIIRF